MRPSVFYLSLSGLVFGIVALLWLWYNYHPLADGRGLAFTGLTAFTLLNVFFYHLAAYLSKHSMDQAYLMMTWLNFLCKVLIALGLPVIFYFKYHLTGAAFIVPFLCVYVAFTVFETWVLNKLAIMRRT